MLGFFLTMLAVSPWENFHLRFVVLFQQFSSVMNGFITLTCCCQVATYLFSITLFHWAGFEITTGCISNQLNYPIYTQLHCHILRASRTELWQSSKLACIAENFDHFVQLFIMWYQLKTIENALSIDQWNSFLKLCDWRNSDWTLLLQQTWDWSRRVQVCAYRITIFHPRHL